MSVPNETYYQIIEAFYVSNHEPEVIASFCKMSLQEVCEIIKQERINVTEALVLSLIPVEWWNKGASKRNNVFKVGNQLSL